MDKPMVKWLMFLGLITLLDIVAHLTGQTKVLGLSYGSVSSPRNITFSCPNDVTTGTTNRLTAKLNSTGQCLTVAANEVTTPVGIVVSGGGKTGSSLIAVQGVVTCTFDNTTTAGHTALTSTAVDGNCGDGAIVTATAGISQTVMGIILDSGAAGTHSVLLKSPIGELAKIGTGTFSLPDPGLAGVAEFQAKTGTTFCMQLGGKTTNGFPAFLEVNSTLLQVKQSSSTGNGCAGGDGNLGTGHLAALNTAPPSIASGFGSTPSIVSGGDTAFIVNVGTGGAATTGVVNFGTAFTTAPACISQDVTANHPTVAVGATGTVTLTASTAWGASDKVSVICFGQNGL